MTACPHTDRLDAFLDGDLASTEAATFEAHAAECDACTEAVERAERLALGFEALAEEACPDDVWEATLAEIATLGAERDRPAERTAIVHRPRWPLVTAATLALAALALLVLRPLTDTAAPDTPLATADPPATELPDTRPAADSSDTELIAPPSEEVAQIPEQVPRQVRRRALAPPDAPTPPIAQAPAPEPPPTAEEVSEARDGALLALALVADASQHAEVTLRRDVRGPLNAAADALDLALLR